MGMPDQSMQLIQYQGALWVPVNWRDCNVIVRKVMDEKGHKIPYRSEGSVKIAISKEVWDEAPKVEAAHLDREDL